MRIEKDNIVIRSAAIDDAAQLNIWWNDGKVMEIVGFPNGLGESLEDTINNIKGWEGKLSQLCIIEIDGKPVGELNYKINDDNAAYPGWKICDFNYQNKGYGTKIITMLFEFIFTDEAINTRFHIKKIVWDTTFENKRAQHVYETKIGAKKIGVQEKSWKDQLGIWRSAVDYEITREVFFNSTTSIGSVKRDKLVMDSNIEIKAFEESDYESFVNMFNSYFLNDCDIKLKYSEIEEICSEIIETSKREVSPLYLIKINKKPVGFIIYQIDTPRSDWCQKEGFGFIRELYIEKNFRKRGLGKLLFTHVEKILEDKSVEQIYLTADDAGEFWERCGFTKTSEVGYKNQIPIFLKHINQSLYK